MSGLNQCNFIGYLGKDPESRAMPNGDTVTNFSIGVSERWKDKQSGEQKEKTEWINCVAWRKLAEIINDYARKGQQVFVSGKMQTRKWKDKQNNDRWTTEVLVDTFTMLGKKGDNENTGGRDRGGSSGGSGGGNQGSGSAPDQGGFDDDIPF